MKFLVDQLTVAVCISIGIFYLGCVTCIELNQNENLIVDAGSLGKIRGIQFWTLGPTNATRRQYLSFSGIKYAKPPTGENRFRPSELATGNLTEEGQSYFSATSPGASCSQPSVVVPIPQSEDCLSLNVHTPRLPQGNSTLLPVIVFIHGGAFTAGTGGTYNGGRLLNKDVVLVSINYRLGAFGFFTLNNEDAPGNGGLYDMLNALKWVKQYIRYFGGDPDRVTVTGQSSGSVAVTHLLASPLARGLFHGAIGTSGSALAKWGTATSENALISSLRLSEIANCYDPAGGHPDPEYLKQIAKCMKDNVNATALVNALMQYQVEERLEGRLGFAAVSAVVQDFDAPGVEKIVPEHPEDVFKSGRQTNVPLMMGACRHDGSYPLGVLYQRYLRPNGFVNDREFMSRQVIPKVLEALDIEADLGIQNTIAKTYLGDSRKSGNFSQMYPGFIDLFSVFFFKAPAYQTALYHAQLNSSNTYWYSLDYVGFYTMFGILFMGDRPPIRSGIGHGDDLIYIFQTSLFLNEADYAVSNRMVQYWVNFAYSGNPTRTPDPSWPALNVSDQKYYSFGSEDVVLDHYEDYWSGVGWEVLPTTIPTRNPADASSTTPISEEGESTTAGASSLSYSIYFSISALLYVTFTSIYS